MLIYSISKAFIYLTSLSWNENDLSEKQLKFKIMEKLYIETKACLHRLNDLLGRFESTIKNDSAETAIKESINSLFQEINTNFNQLDLYVTKEPATRKYDSKIKVDQIKYDFQHYKAALNTIQYKK